MPEFEKVDSKHKREFSRFNVLADGKDKTVTLPVSVGAKLEKLIDRGRFVPTAEEVETIKRFNLDARSFPAFEPNEPAQIEISKVEHVADLKSSRWL